MKLHTLMVVLLVVTLVLFVMVSNVSCAADDGASLYKTKCAACHGIDGAGQPAARIPSLISEEMKSAPDEGLSEDIAKGGPSKRPSHAFESKGLSPDHIRMIVSYIRELQKKQ